MRINTVNSQINYYQQNAINKNRTNKNTFNNVKDTIETNTKTFKLDKNQTADPSVWDKLSKEYDITNASFNEFNEICDKLYKAGQISLLEKGKLTFIPRIIAKAKKMTNNNINPLLTSKNKTTDWENEKINWIEELNTRAEQQKKLGSLSNYEQYKDFAKCFKKLL